MEPRSVTLAMRASMENLPAHSILGASGAERWMNCPGSVELLKTLKLPESDEPDYRRDGTAAHAAGAKCLEQASDAWEITDDLIAAGIAEDEVSAHADAVQVYLDTVRPMIEAARAGNGVYGVEERFHRPELHPLYFGAIDFWYFHEDLLDVTDYKHGEGIAVDVDWNPQVMYYAYGKLQQFPEARRVRLRIVQPRGFHPEGPVREWTLDAETLCNWAEGELMPAMIRVEMDHSLDAGPWCRFCPAKLVCPLMDSLFGAAMKADPKHVVDQSNEGIGRSYQYTQAVKFYLKALEDEVYRRNNLGDTVPGTKLVAKKANRVFKAGAKEIMAARFGDDAFTPRELKTPAKIEDLGSDAKELVKEWAYTPLTGLTVALEADKRPAVKVQTTAQAFGDAAAKAMEGASV